MFLCWFGIIGFFDVGNLFVGGGCVCEYFICYKSEKIKIFDYLSFLNGIVIIFSKIG